MLQDIDAHIVNTDTGTAIAGSDRTARSARTDADHGTNAQSRQEMRTDAWSGIALNTRRQVTAIPNPMQQSTQTDIYPILQLAFAEVP